MSIVPELQSLIEEGEELAPQGGSRFEGYNGKLQPQYSSWRFAAMDAIGQLGAAGKSLVQEMNDEDLKYFYESSAQMVLGGLKGALRIAERDAPAVPSEAETDSKSSRRVFVVHGHDDAIREAVARFLSKLGLEPVLLFEQPSQSRTLIEKLELQGDVSFAVILLTPDDVGRAAAQEELQPRARQNVMLELGFFIGRLGRTKVCALYEPSVELPSDYHGVAYVELDPAAAWKLQLGRELKAAGVEVDMNRAV